MARAVARAVVEMEAAVRAAGATAEAMEVAEMVEDSEAVARVVEMRWR